MLVDDQMIKRVIRKRQSDSHKGSYGRVLLVGGLYPYGGAIIMAAIACVKSGAGLVTVATDRENIVALHSHLPEAMAFDIRDEALFGENIVAADVVLVGPGLGETALAQASFDHILTDLRPEQILITDGSALNLLAQKDKKTLLKGRWVLTPHQKEWERLSGLPVDQQDEQGTRQILTQFPEDTILVAKSHTTKVYQGNSTVALGVGGPYQATGGMGDTLAGMIAGFTAQFGNRDLFETVTVAAWLHSAIADDLAQDAYVVLPTRISQQIPAWMKKWSN